MISVGWNWCQVQHKLFSLLVVHVEEALLLVQRAEGLHIGIGEGEVEYLGILHNFYSLKSVGEAPRYF